METLNEARLSIVLQEYLKDGRILSPLEANQREPVFMGGNGEPAVKYLLKKSTSRNIYIFSFLQTLRKQCPSDSECGCRRSCKGNFIDHFTFVMKVRWLKISVWFCFILQLRRTEVSVEAKQQAFPVRGEKWYAIIFLPPQNNPVSMSRVYLH